jgi:hypothetical protein
MGTPTSILVDTGLVAVAYGFICCGIYHAHKRSQRAETGHDRAERREWHWYWNKDRSKDVENIPFEGPLN